MAIKKTGKKNDLSSQLEAAQSEVRADGYEMSIGELISIYERNEIVINPRYQRLFRWSQDQKTKFIESILIGIPIPPIFVFQTSDGKWELVDGLQRLSTLLEFRGLLAKPGTGKKKLHAPPSRLLGTSLMPGLEGIGWEKKGTESALPDAMKLRLLRSRIRVEILQTGSSTRSRYELFQRLNTGGSLLTRQEIRTCSVIMADPPFQEWLEDLAKFSSFKETTKLTKVATDKQRHVELVVKYFVFNFVTYRSEWDLHDYLDEGVVKLALDPSFDRVKSAEEFKQVFILISSSLGENAFRRTSSGKVVGSFSDAAFEALSVGVRKNLTGLKGKSKSLPEKLLSMWADPAFKKNTGAGVRGTTRIAKILPFAKDHFKG